MNKLQLIKKPVLTEKAAQLVHKNVYTFLVSTHSNKHQIAQTIERLYTVKVSDVRTVTRTGKVRRVGRKMQPVLAQDTKIAYVHLKEGKIDIFPQS